MNNPIIEVELRDKGGKLCLNEREDTQYNQVIRLFETRIYEEVGGILCFDHYHVPTLEPQYSKGRWAVRITCCCEEHMNAVESRLHEQFT
jgi:hypothetical protein